MRNHETKLFLTNGKLFKKPHIQSVTQGGKAGDGPGEGPDQESGLVGSGEAQRPLTRGSGARLGWVGSKYRRRRTEETGAPNKRPTAISHYHPQSPQIHVEHLLRARPWDKH